MATNKFRIFLTQQKLVNEKIKGESNVNSTHYEAGKAIRKTIIKVVTTVSKKLPIPDNQ